MKVRIQQACAVFVCLSVVWRVAGAQEPATPAIPGVVSAGTAVQLVKDGFEAVEGPVPQPDGGLLFTNNRAGHIMRIAPDGSLSVWLEKSGGANALTWAPNGELAATLVGDLVVAVMQPGVVPRVLAHDYEGKPFNRPNDLIANHRGQIFFTDTAALNATDPVLPSALYQLTPQGQVLRLTTDIARPNGVALSPDERRLYVANTAGEWVVVFDLDRHGNVKGHRDFAKLALPPLQNGANAGSGADGLAVDARGRLFVATAVGVQVFSQKGEPLGTIVLPKQPQNLAFAGPGRATLYVVGRGAVYRIATLTRGPHRAGK